MKYAEAMKIIKEGLNPGFMVHFDEIQGCCLCGKYFPDKHAGEKLLESEELAWDLARQFAARTYGKYVNIYVIDGDFYPVPGYEKKMIVNR